MLTDIAVLILVTILVESPMAVTICYYRLVGGGFWMIDDGTILQ